MLHKIQGVTQEYYHIFYFATKVGRRSLKRNIYEYLAQFGVNGKEIRKQCYYNRK